MSPGADVTARERHGGNRPVREGEDRLRDLIDGLAPSMFVGLMTREGILVEANWSAVNAAGVTTHDVIGQRLEDTYWWSYDEAVQQRLREAIDGAARGEAAHYDARMRVAEEQFIDVDFSLQPLRDAHGEVVAMVPSAIVVTERRQIESALRASDEKFHQLADHITDAFWIRSPDMSEVHYISPAFERIWGRSVASLTANPHQWADFIFPDDRARVVGAFEALVVDAPSLDIEYRILRPDGEVRWVRVRGFQVRDPANTLVRHTGIVTDITDRKRAESALAESEGRYRALVDWSPESIAVTRRGTILFVNPATVRMMGAARAEDLIGKPFLDMVHPDFRGIVSARLKRTTEPGGVLPLIEERLIKLDGTVIDVEIQGTSIMYGEEPATFSSIREITEQKRAAQALRTSMEEFRTLAEAMPQIVWITQPDGYNVYFNQHWMDYTGLSAEESRGHGWNTAFHPDDLPRASDEWQRATATTGTSSIESRLRRADGEYRWWLVRGVPLQDAAGTILRWFGTCTDIHDLKLAELEVFRVNRALKMLSSCNEMLIRAEHEEALLEQICAIAVKHGGYRMAWVGYALDDETRTIVPRAHAGIDDGYLSTITSSWNENDPLGQGPAGQALRTGQAVVCEDIIQAPAFAPWLAPAQQAGYRGVICLPLREASQTFGLLTLYSAEVKQTSAGEMKLLQDLADDVAFGIASLRVRSERQRLHAAVVTVAASVSAATGTAFFEQLARHMAEAVGAQGGFVARLQAENPRAARTVAAVVDGDVTDGFDFLIDRTPCESVLASNASVISNRAAEHFSEVPALAALGSQGFAGRRLTSSSGQPLGLLFVVFREPLTHVEFVTSTLQIFAARAASELERQQTDDRVREQAALLDIASEAILVRDLEERILFWNKGAERTYGWTAAEVLGRKSSEFHNPEGENFRHALATVLTTGEWHGELLQATRDGRGVMVEGRWTLVRDAKGQPKSILAINTDLTERKKLEAQFLRAQRMEGIGTLAGGIAHDLNNVLAPIVMSLEMLKERVTDQECLTLVDTLQNSAQRGAALVKQVLSFARGVEGQRLVVNPIRVMRDLLEVMRDTFPKSIDVRFTPARDLWSVTGDPTQMHQVLLNLCVNARDAMPGGGTLTVSMDNVVLNETDRGLNSNARPGRYVLVKVEDTGTGIPPEIRDRICEPFFTTKGIGEGTGLGLSTTLAIVKSHGGFIDVYSAMGKGTAFRVYLPANAVPAAEERVAAQDAALPRGHGELILLVDDEEAIRVVARQILERFGYRVMVACDGAEGLALYVRHQSEIAVVLTDMAMPIMDGPTLIANLQALNPRIRVISSSGLMSAAEAVGAGGAGVHLFVPKPYTAGVMLKTLQSVLQTPLNP